jgi:hypothetical protein
MKNLGLKPWTNGRAGFVRGTAQRVGEQHAIAGELAREFPGVLDRTQVVGWMQGERNQATARQLRDHIKALVPDEDASTVDRIFSDERIRAAWKKVGKPR